MEKRLGGSAGLVALLALGFHTFVGTGAEHPAQQPLSRALIRAHNDSPAGITPVKQMDNPPGPWLATEQYFYRVNASAVPQSCVVEVPNSKAPVCKGADALALFGFPAGFETNNLETLIATVPDPLHTRMSIATDRTLDAIQQAAYRSTWELAAQWLPWTSETASSSSSGGELAGSASTKPWEKLPGLILFRHHLSDGSRQRLLLIFIVGETPTAGINGFQFQAARRYISLLSTQRPAAQKSREIRIAGPNFSGSLQSLARLLEDDKSYTYEMRSGSVSNLAYACSALSELKTANVTAHLHGATLPTAVFRKHFVELVHEWHYRDDQAVELAEDESGFSYRDKSYKERCEDTDSDVSAIATYRYPRDIAQLRNAYTDVAFAPSAVSGSAASGIDFSLKDTQAGEDVFPMFSSHTTASQNAVLQQIVQNLNRDSIRVVSLTATNVFDTIFLARVLRRYCPDIRVVLNGTDALFIQDSVQGSLTGLMAVSAYPMFAEGIAWDHLGEHDFTTFADTDSVGEFNSVLTLLNGDSKYRQPFSGWLLVLGHNGWSPVKQLAANKTAAAWFGFPLETKLNAPLSLAGNVWGLVCLLTASLSLGFCARLHYLGWRPDILVWSSLCLSDLHHPAEEKSAFTPILNGRYFCLFACLSALVFLTGTLLLPMVAARYVHPSPVAAIPIEWIMAVAFLVPLGTNIYLATIVPWWPQGERRPGFAAILRGCVLLVPFVALGLWWAECADPVSGWLFCLRAVALAPSVCPVWPPLLAGVALFLIAFFHLRRFTLVHRQEPIIETTILDDFLWNQFSNLKAKLSAVAISPVGCFGNNTRVFANTVVIVSLALAALPLIIPRESLRSFEGFSYEGLLITLMVPLAMFIALSLVQFVRYWSLVRTFLVTLNGIALGRFFVRQSDFEGTGPVWSRGVKLMCLATSIDSAIALHNLERQIPTVQPYRRDYWQALRRLLNPCSTAATRHELIHAYHNFRSTAAEVSGILSRHVLSPYWAANALPFARSDADGSSSAAGDNADTLKHSGGMDDLYQTASRYVVLQYQAFVAYCMRQLQNLLLCCTSSFVLLVLALDSFSFQAPRSISRLLIIALCVGAFAVVRVLAQVERDPILSRLSGTTEGELGKEFYVKVAMYGALPVLTVIGSQFPSISGFLSSWAQPALASLH